MLETAVVNPQPIKPASSEHAGFGVRFVAALLDGFILLAINILVNQLFGLNKIGGNLSGFINIVINWGYAVYFIGSSGATLGKRVMHLKVVKTNGSSVTYGDALMRELLGKLVSLLTLGIGYLWVLWDPQKQALHDKIANTYVMKVG